MRIKVGGVGTEKPFSIGVASGPTCSSLTSHDPNKKYQYQLIIETFSSLTLFLKVYSISSQSAPKVTASFLRVGYTEVLIEKLIIENYQFWQKLTENYPETTS